MGEIRTALTLENSVDREIGPEADVRQVTPGRHRRHRHGQPGRPGRGRKDSDRYKVAKCIQAEPVFCGFGRSAHSKVISVSVLTRLGLRHFSSRTVAHERCPVAGPVTVRIGDRETTTDCVVGPPRSQTVVGYTVLAMLDLVTDEAIGAIRPRHPGGVVWRV